MICEVQSVFLTVPNNEKECAGGGGEGGGTRQSAGQATGTHQPAHPTPSPSLGDAKGSTPDLGFPP